MSCSHCGGDHDGAATCARTDKSADEPGLCGTTIDRYEIEALLSSGGFGAVYSGRHVHTRRAVAVKVLDASLSEDAAMVVRFKREAQALAAIESPHVVQVLDWGVRPTGEAYLVMEKLVGRDLRELVDGRLPRERALAIARQLLAALSVVQAAGIVHRDLKPANVFLVETEGTLLVKLIDFGISRQSTIANDPFRTATGSTFGSPGYMAPEQVRTNVVDGRADIYAAGVVIYQLLSGVLPHVFETYEDYVVRVCTEEPRPLLDAAPGIPPGIGRAVMRALEIDPDKRWQTAGDFARALAATDAELPTQPMRTPQAPPVLANNAFDTTVRAAPRTDDAPPLEKLPSPRRGPLLGVAAITILGLAGAGVWWMSREPVRSAATPGVVPADAAALATAPDAAPPDTAPIVADAADPADAAPAVAITIAKPKPHPVAWLDAELAKIPCASPHSCPMLRCACNSGGHEVGATCNGTTCARVAATCAAACGKLGGWAGGVTEGVRYGHGRTDNDCKVSTLCAREGRCILRESECVKASCRETAACREQGLCVDDGDNCVISDHDCARAAVCRERGACKAGGNRCGARSDADCRASAACKTDGACVMTGTSCAVGDEADCASSTQCAKAGLCKWSRGYSACYR